MLDEAVEFRQTDSMIAAVLTELDEQGITQKKMAEVLGVSQKHISMIANGHADPSFKMLDRMLDYLGLELRVVKRAR